MGITGRQGSWKTKFWGWGGVGRGRLAWCLVPADSPGPDLTVGGYVGDSSVLKRGVWVKGKLNSAKPLAIIA